MLRAGQKLKVCLSNSVPQGAIKTSLDSRRAGRMPPAAHEITPLLPPKKREYVNNMLQNIPAFTHCFKGEMPFFARGKRVECGQSQFQQKHTVSAKRCF